MADQTHSGEVTISRRALLAAGAGTALTATAGCTQIKGALGMGLPNCSGKQRNFPLLSIGNANSSVTVTEYTDYDCPHCADFALKTFPTIDQQYIRSGKIKYVHRDFPLPVSKWSAPVANAVRSVQTQATNRVAFNYTGVMYEKGQKQDNYSDDFIENRAAKLNGQVNAGQVRSAANNNPYCEGIRNEKQQGKDKGVEGTPTLFVNEKMLEAPSLDELTSAIENALP